MNTRLDFIFTRRSVREYLDKDIPAAMLHDLLEAGMAAPSARAADPLHFIVITERAGLDAIATVLPYAKMLHSAPAAIVVCGDLERAPGGLESNLVQDGSAAVENILLAATALGLGSCWLGVHPHQERIDGLRALLQLPFTIVPVAGIALGWPAVVAEARTRYRPERIHWERWQ